MVFVTRKPSVTQWVFEKYVVFMGLRQTYCTSDAGEIADLVKCLLNMYVDLDLIPSTHVKSSSGGHGCDPSAGEAETKGSLALAGQSVQLCWRFSERPFLQSWNGKSIRKTPLDPTCVHRCSSAHTRTYIHTLKRRSMLHFLQAKF